MDIQEIIETVTQEEIKIAEQATLASFEDGVAGSQMIMIAFD